MECTGGFILDIFGLQNIVKLCSFFMWLLENLGFFKMSHNVFLLGNTIVDSVSRFFRQNSFDLVSSLSLTVV